MHDQEKAFLLYVCDAANGYSREMEHWLTGSAVLQNRTNEKDELRSHYRTERGFEGFAPNRFLLFKKS